MMINDDQEGRSIIHLHKHRGFLNTIMETTRESIGINRSQHFYRQFLCLKRVKVVCLLYCGSHSRTAGNWIVQ